MKKQTLKQMTLQMLPMKNKNVQQLGQNINSSKGQIYQLHVDLCLQNTQTPASTGYVWLQSQVSLISLNIYITTLYW